jgi:energy-coupling factor transport system ATP-binding protein
MFFNGKIVSTECPNAFFTHNSFYTTAVSRMTRGYFDNAVTLEDAVELCHINGRKG